MTANQRVTLQIPSLLEEVQPYLVPSTPPVLSLGRMCIEDGYGFHWPPHGTPILVTPKGKSICLQVHNLCPYLDDGSRSIKVGDLSDGPEFVGQGHDNLGAVPAGGGGSSSSKDPPPSSTRADPQVSSGRGSSREVKPGSAGDSGARGSMDPPPAAVPPAPKPDGPSPGVGPPPDSGEIDPVPGPIRDVIDQASNDADAAKSLHHLMTHTPKNKFCETCRRAKAQKRPSVKRSARADPGPMPEKFGEVITADHIVTLDAGDKALHGERNALVMKDIAAGFLSCYPAAERSYSEALKAVLHFVGPKEKVGLFYSDNNGEMKKAATTLGLRHRNSTPGVPQTNGIVEREVRRILDGTRSALLHAGFPTRWWSWAIQHFCWAYNFTNRPSRASPFVERSGGPFNGLTVPFGALVYAIPTPVQKKNRPAKFAPKAQPMLFMGWAFHDGAAWSKDYYVLPVDELSRLSLESITRAKVQRVDRIILADGAFRFPAKDGYEKKARTVDRGDAREEQWLPASDAETASGEAASAAEEADDSDYWSAYDSNGEDVPPTVCPANLGRYRSDPEPPVRNIMISTKSQDGESNIIRAPLDCPVDIWSSVWEEWTDEQRIAEVSRLALVARSQDSPDDGPPPGCDDEHDFVPAMPTNSWIPPHRERLSQSPFPFNVLVARPVGRKERTSNPRARESVQKEWDKLRRAGKCGCWDESGVREWADVAAEARRNKMKAHVGAIFDICVEKGSELPAGDPARKFKGRVVFQGNRVKDENYDIAMFSDLSSSPASMEAGKAADAYGLFPGNTVEQSDAEQAYTQAELGGDRTWVRLPKEQWPKAWKNMKDPVCPLLLALYGHPDSGGFWEQHCEKHLRSVGFVPVDGWRSCYWHARLKLFLTVYVDDFKMAGPKGSMAEGWKLIRKGIRAEDPTPAGKYLGCDHIMSALEVQDGISPATGFGNYLESGREVPKTLRSAKRGRRMVNVMMYDMEGFMTQCHERYSQAAGTNARPLRRVDTPFLDESKAPPDDDPPGVLAPIASSVLMKIL